MYFLADIRTWFLQMSADIHVCVWSCVLFHIKHRCSYRCFFVCNFYNFFLSLRCLVKTKGSFWSYIFIHLATSSFQMNPYDYEMLLDGEWIWCDSCENTLKLDGKFLLLLYDMSMVAYLWKEDPPQNWKSQLLCHLTFSFPLVSDVMPLILTFKNRASYI
jgi:hypothetical protein